MATREKIREELKVHFRLALAYKGMDSSIADSLSISSLYLLSELDVVIKVDRELPECPYTKDELLIGAYKEAQEDFVEAGYVATAPLIKEETDGN